MNSKTFWWDFLKNLDWGNVGDWAGVAIAGIAAYVTYRSITAAIELSKKPKNPALLNIHAQVDVRRYYDGTIKTIQYMCLNLFIENRGEQTALVKLFSFVVKNQGSNEGNLGLPSSYDVTPEIKGGDVKLIPLVLKREASYSATDPVISYPFLNDLYDEIEECVLQHENLQNSELDSELEKILNEKCYV
ncbi:hypothetical protein ACRHK7_06175 [Weissella tructae]|uniref:Uncharacterized protein n=2 Tax=Weissella TaxID=46255 RepID=A0A075U618_9LACO|nr:MULTISPECIES: hypothetical protein [Weissella]AIG65567.1 hypothetical protein WS08_0628 [Weissella tructae]AIM62881.1 hypothetical protein WS74_0629 [Weissella ceti]AIM64279.1 hypothetical protein WS105_0689 [Weissella ceti]ELA06976.1 hypothetical protein WCNC_05332 [Weissella ceti NC36]QVV90698.1 hypothetical protein KHQ32_03410 [Weissella tructae]